MTFAEGEKACRDRNLWFALPGSVSRIDELAQMFRDDFNVPASPDGEGPGVWFHFRRQILAPEGFTDYQIVRKDKSLWSNPWHGGTMSASLWRADQPGDKTDERDERCCALKDVHLYNQLDDFPCDGDQYKKHFAICHQHLPFFE